MKRKILIIVIVIILLSALYIAFQTVRNLANREVVENLRGKLYYTRRVDGVSTLFQSDANLKNEKIIYSHKGKGKAKDGSNNDNIIGFYYDEETEDIKFVAMYNGEWSLFSIKAGEKEPTLVESKDNLRDGLMYRKLTEYIKNIEEGISVVERKGSLYLTKDGEETCIKRFYGIYDEKFTGYTPIGLSPDGKYLIYHSMEHISPIATLLDGMITGDVGNHYIMELETGRSARYKAIGNIQWIME